MCDKFHGFFAVLSTHAIGELGVISSIVDLGGYKKQRSRIGLFLSMLLYISCFFMSALMLQKHIPKRTKRWLYKGVRDSM